MILLIDNYDSFVHNLARYTGQAGRPRTVVRNDAITIRDIAVMAPEAIILSPGPCAPGQAGICLELIEKFHRIIPILGICLGHQCIGEVFGGRTVRAAQPMHGKASVIEHDRSDMFAGLPRRMRGARYHSLVTELPALTKLTVSARVKDEDTIMAIRHAHYPVRGLQFHPESVLTEYGEELMLNFFALADAWNAVRKAA
jgi:anthranilate synthase/aminodeoxychorismate synthase-like glutamine amidotransferase